MKYFEGSTQEEIKKEYRDLSKKHHPDLGGTASIMKEINAEYKEAIQKVLQEEGKSLTEIEDFMAHDEKLRDALNEIIMINEVDAEICGCWIWVTGKTKEFKEKLKKAGFRWASKKKAWYWRDESQKKSKSRRQVSLDKIRALHGSKRIENNIPLIK